MPHRDDEDDGAQPSRAIAPATQSRRVVRLRKQHGTLLAKVRQKRSAIARLEDEGATVARELDQRSASLRSERHGYDRDVHAHFDAIERDPAQPRATRIAVRALYRALQDIGAITERTPVPNVPASEETPAPAARDATPMRPTFLRLARAYHPDKTTDDAERERHTEVMKELNAAYRGGDVSRLLELEKTLADSADVAELDATTLESRIDALQGQLRDVRKEMTALRARYEGAIALEYRQLARAGQADPVASMVEQVRRATAQTRWLRDLLQQFCDGNLGLDALLSGPAEDGDDDDGWLARGFARARESADSGPPKRRSRR